MQPPIVPRPSRRHVLLVAVVILLITGSFGTAGVGAAAAVTLPAAQNDCGVGGDAGPSFAEASAISVPQVDCTGDLLVALDEQDWYQFPLASGQAVTARVRFGHTAVLSLCLYNPSGSSAICGQTLWGATTRSFSFTANADGNWRLVVSGYALAESSYTMSVSPGAPPPPPQDDCGTGVDAGGSHAAATPIVLPQVNCVGSLGTGDLGDWYQFSIVGGQTIHATMTPNSAADHDICLYQPSGVVAGCSSSGLAGASETLTHLATASGNYRLGVELRSGSGNYTLSISTTDQDDCGIGGDAGGSHAAATPIVLPKTNCTGVLVPSPDTADWYQFPVTRGQIINASLANAAGLVSDICIHVPSGTHATACNGGSVGYPVTITHAATTTGNYRVSVSLRSGGGQYTMSLSTSGEAQDDCATNGDAGNSHAAAIYVGPLPRNCGATLIAADNDTEDWYMFAVTKTQTISVSMTPNASSNFDICLYSRSGILVAGCTAGAAGGTDTLTHIATASDEYYLRVVISSGTGSYTMSLSSGGGHNDCDRPYDAGDSHYMAAQIPLPKTNCTGDLIANSDAQDWYYFSVDSGETITASMTPNASSNFDVCLYNPSNASVPVACSYAGTGTDSVTYTANVSGYWRFQIYIYGTSPGGSYTMSVSAS